MMHRAFLIAGSLLCWVGCGGTEPVSLLGDSSQSLVSTFSIPTSTTPNSFSPYTSANTGFSFGTTIGSAIKAPANGLVIAVTAGQSVTFFHNYQVTSVLQGLTSTVQPGTYVYAGTQVGTVNSTSAIVTLSVYVSGVVQCPLTYMSSAARTTITQLLELMSSTSGACQI